MRFRTELLPILPVVLAASAALPLEGCKKEDKPATSVDGGSSQTPPIVIRNKEDIPVQLGGAPVQWTPPPTPSQNAPPQNAPSPTGAPAPAKGGAAAAGAQAPAAAPAPAPAPLAAQPSALAIVHNHPPGQPCNPLKREEVEKALSDLQKKSQ